MTHTGATGPSRYAALRIRDVRLVRPRSPDAPVRRGGAYPLAETPPRRIDSPGRMFSRGSAFRFPFLRCRPARVALVAVLIGLSQPGRAQDEPPAKFVPVADSAPTIEELVRQLGDESYVRRAEATRRLIAIGPRIEAELRRLARFEDDPEIRRRLRFIVENLAPPERAVLVVRPGPGSDLAPGDLITRANGRRVRDADELRRLLENAPEASVLQVIGPGGPEDRGPLTLGQVGEVLDYRAPRGPTLAAALRLYADGLAEQAYELLASVRGPIPESEFSPLLRARIAFTAGYQSAAEEILRDRVEAVRPEGTGGMLWGGPSLLDLAGPGEAPFHLELMLFERGGPAAYERGGDPDLRVQRVLVPARRYGDALLASAQLWWTRYRERLGRSSDDNIAAGNMLAVVGWMLSEMDLLSECCWLIRPRSAILAFTWIRVQTDAWLAFLAGQERQALDSFYEDARQVLQRQLGPQHAQSLTRNPVVAATVAFFLYQFPDDPRPREALDLVNAPGHPAILAYLEWMLFALTERNSDAIRRHAAQILPNLDDRQALFGARAVALLEYVRDQPQDEVLLAARQRIAQAGSDLDHVLWTAIVDALRHLSAQRPTQALEVLTPFADRREVATLLSTARFLAEPPASADRHDLLTRPLLVAPLGHSGQEWLVLARDHRLFHFDAAQGRLAPLERPTPSWFPGPLNWPWVGRHEKSGRTWVYDRRRLVELTPGRPHPLRLNLKHGEIGPFDRHVAPFFPLLADAIAAAPFEAGEAGEFLRREVQAHAEFVTDPDLPEIGWIEALPEDARVLHVALRGGPHLLVDVTSGRAWTSIWIAQQLGLDSPLTFFARAARPSGTNPPLVLLMSNHGLIRFDLGAQTLTRLPLPGPQAHPAVIPEDVPYTRRDARFVYCARLPEEGGQVFRLHVADSRVEAVDLVNESLPPGYYAVRSRAALRAYLDQRLQGAGLPPLQELLIDARQVVERWQQELQP